MKKTFRTDVPEYSEYLPHTPNILGKKIPITFMIAMFFLPNPCTPTEKANEVILIVLVS